MQPQEPTCQDPFCGHWLGLELISTQAALAGHVLQQFPPGTVWATQHPFGHVGGPTIAPGAMVLHVPHDWDEDARGRDE